MDNKQVINDWTKMKDSTRQTLKRYRKIAYELPLKELQKRIINQYKSLIFLEYAIASGLGIMDIKLPLEQEFAIEKFNRFIVPNLSKGGAVEIFMDLLHRCFETASLISQKE